MCADALSFKEGNNQQRKFLVARPRGTFIATKKTTAERSKEPWPVDIVNSS